ncbi:MAG: pimeloyl-CoA dehydrogenase large subunit [Rhodospirillales bacterium 20-60-12]|jgi:pimeloyl-CoA dehydrogenase large subunit|nr:MAG: pimeloyl-CoA dehydrogenase large subunit [Rhodospirillales bacterium 20-60-12]HQT68107.1 pimeloyl-CoA dehydrogenase large subunit [Acetobacteraceae bacterium]
MDLSFSPEEVAFRDEVRSFIRDHLAPETRAKLIEGREIGKQDIVDWQKALHARGWAVPHWPVEYGGQNWSPVQEYIFLDELQMAPAPSALPFNVSMVGPVIATFGSAEQKAKFLPGTANLDIWWCQGFSEPGAGSDLAGLKTTARREGDEYIINGQKTWTTLAQYADWIFVLARTNPAAAKKQEGISFILVDMKTPGVSVRPIQLIDGGHEVNEVWFDEVRVPAENLVGQENKGWDYAKFLLGNERMGIARIGTSKQRLKRIRELAKLERFGDTQLLDQPWFREKLTAVEIELKALEITQLRVVAEARKRGKHGTPDPNSSILKIKGSEIQQATTELMMDVVGPYVMPFGASLDDEDQTNEPPIGPDYAAAAAPTYFNWRKISIYGGSNEIQHSIIAKAILGF